MKILQLVFISLIFSVAGATSTTAQGLPESPSPAPLADPAWNRLQTIAYGTPIVVTDIRGNSIHCLFDLATDAYLFCNTPANPSAPRVRIDHADVIAVDADLAARATFQTTSPERNYHPAWLSSMIAGGIIVGLCASRNTDAGRAAADGIIGAGIVGLIGAPFAFLPRTDAAAGPPFPFYGVGIPLSRRARSHPRMNSAGRLFR